jgi:hypothetical protein
MINEFHVVLKTIGCTCDEAGWNRDKLVADTGCLVPFVDFEEVKNRI